MTLTDTAMQHIDHDAIASPPFPAHGGRRFAGYLPMNQILQVGDHLVSANGLFFATLESDGTFRVYRGIDQDEAQGLLWSSRKTGERGRYFALVQSDGNFCVYQGSDLAHNCGWHWGTQMTAQGQQFYAAMQDDGNFSIRAGTGPDDSRGPIWATSVTDHVLSIEEVLHIEYDFSRACVLRTSPASQYSEVVTNHGSTATSHALAGSIAITETSSWTNTPAATLGPDVEYRHGVPGVSGDDFILSDEPVDYVANCAITRMTDWAFDTPYNVPPHVSMRAAIALTYSTISVPYVLVGQLRFESGARVVGAIRGNYLGTNAHSLTASFTPHDPSPNVGKRILRPLRPLAGMVAY
ncbi:hypothetical protein GCM10027277_43570 [Pseudoduganella ginsengisoli]|uniref:Bulb-type lectin domain-containing protein n=1 Tax=Pseudoduganella ginsengisoli TaxID=1462440 RepID=A0A6L6Q6B2_9BURK|nr:hypothetical protein [Pseudoduganella ginsengisoli]MTW05046.1 hypothetical protein [Pseudoduganella ginsengisoli]